MEDTAGDLVVVVPGILGSTLSRGPRQVWGYSSVARLHRLSSRLTEDLALPGEAFADPEHGFNDGARPTGMLRTLGVLPGFLTIDGYDRLVSGLRREFAPASQDAVIEFPYDWRQSNEYTARRLKSVVEPLLRHRRRRRPDARIVFLGHSMGGLVARYYAECLDSERLTRRVITIGTPFQGAAKALAVLANGYASLGPRRFRLGELVRSLPSVAELLPVYECFGPGSGALESIRTALIPGLPDFCRVRALQFHQRMNEAVVANGSDRPTYHAVLSCRQKTPTWASRGGDGEILLQVPTEPARRGDGTVPRCSAAPPDWVDDSPAVFVSGRHASMQQQRDVLLQVSGIVTARPRRPMAGIDEIAVEADPCVIPGEEWTVRAESMEGSDHLVLAVTVTEPSKDEVVGTAPLRPCGQGSHSASLRIPRPGTYRWTVHTVPAAATPVEPVSDVLLCAYE
ncbi:esterase/lipase family protein [Streptomyces wuyuanensis]|uniref:esterase/lipase family protein n=1 Tax=Streptomyces wuyuanensis TaxID=1196353 RepID=UPI00380AA031